MDDFSWLGLPVEEAARRLLGCELERTLGPETLRVRIVETEAYSQDDPASHTFSGRTARNEAMFLGPGHAYVYLSYGIHSCLNIVVGREGVGEGVLIRAAEPLEGRDTMALLRGRGGVALTNGPGKLGQALAIDLGLSGHDVALAPLRLLRRPPLGEERVVVTTRIGITKAAELPRRFYDRDSGYVSVRARPVAR
ncbi:DNA-3-methyladenine glycosylase [Galactobacter valiniphilus]|uniref:Putative 3-methyladenine DNA glycosylase n=1 Tax=Galactobacter valiniphilus TaxID=2676122 RepID=A0A399JAC8_9MICC|nr:DNA-3-methyladenine glycosylase [Galactobacter valiniphilus]RII42535.1 DNA-3-methyladenine glycosylase [Galactobacter valiniphilus]